MLEPADQPAKRERSLAGFYIAMGVLAALVVLGMWLWTPAKVLYLERGIRRTTPMGGLVPGREYPHLRLTRNLIDIGPLARAAVERLMADQNTMFRPALLLELGRPGLTWALPMLVKEVERDHDAGDWELLETVDTICDQRFSKGILKKRWVPSLEITMTEWSSDTSEKLRQRILDWWASEGQAKYGGGGK